MAAPSVRDYLLDVKGLYIGRALPLARLAHVLGFWELLIRV